MYQSQLEALHRAHSKGPLTLGITIVHMPYIPPKPNPLPILNPKVALTQTLTLTLPLPSVIHL
jgi:hypothetical protein